MNINRKGSFIIFLWENCTFTCKKIIFIVGSNFRYSYTCFNVKFQQPVWSLGHVFVKLTFEDWSIEETHSPWVREALMDSILNFSTFQKVYSLLRVMADHQFWWGFGTRNPIKTVKPKRPYFSLYCIFWQERLSVYFIYYSDMYTIYICKQQQKIQWMLYPAQSGLICHFKSILYTVVRK